MSVEDCSMNPDILAALNALTTEANDVASDAARIAARMKRDDVKDPDIVSLLEGYLQVLRLIAMMHAVTQGAQADAKRVTQPARMVS